MENLTAWVDDIETRGLDEVRKIRGYHDEALRGKRKDQRSIRLSRAYRAIYVLKELGELKLVNIEEVTKHDY